MQNALLMRTFALALSAAMPFGQARPQRTCKDLNPSPKASCA